MVEGAAFGRVVDRLLDEPELGEELGARLAAERDRPRVCDLLRGVDAAVELGDADGVVPKLVGAVHVDGGAPVLRLDVVLLRELEVALGLELLRQVQVGLGQQVLAVRRHQPDHVVVPAVLLVHVDREVGLVHHHVEALRLLQLAAALEAVGLGDVEHRHLRLAHVLGGDAVGALCSRGRSGVRGERCGAACA